MLVTLNLRGHKGCCPGVVRILPSHVSRPVLRYAGLHKRRRRLKALSSQRDGGTPPLSHLLARLGRGGRAVWVAGGIPAERQPGPVRRSENLIVDSVHRQILLGVGTLLLSFFPNGNEIEHRIAGRHAKQGSDFFIGGFVLPQAVADVNPASP